MSEIFACAGEGKRRPARYRRAFGDESRFPAGLFSAWHPMKPSGGIPVRIPPGLTGGAGECFRLSCRRTGKTGAE